MNKEIAVYVYNGILFSFKKEEILPFITTWMNLEDIMLNEIGQPHKEKTKQNKNNKQQTTAWSNLYVESKKAKYLGAESRKVIIRDKTLGKMGRCLSSTKWLLCRRNVSRDLVYSRMIIVDTALNTGNFLRVVFRWSHHTYTKLLCGEMIC